MVVRMRHTRSHTGNRRSHHFLRSRTVALCENCGEPKLRHSACSVCGKYRNKEVLDVVGKAARKSKKRQEKERELAKNQ